MPLKDGKKNKPWVSELDFLRAVSFLAVVMQHAIGAYANRSGTDVLEVLALGVLFVLTKFAVLELSWLNKATPYTDKIPQSQGPYVWNAYMGPSVLHLLTSDKHQISIFPANYIIKTGKTNTAISEDEHGVVTTTETPEFQVQYVQDVLVFDNGGNRTYLKSEPLYNWLKQDQWVPEFKRG